MFSVSKQVAAKTSLRMLLRSRGKYFQAMLWKLQGSDFNQAVKEELQRVETWLVEMPSTGAFLKLVEMRKFFQMLKAKTTCCEHASRGFKIGRFNS